jgi:hypothetical protein
VVVGDLDVVGIAVLEAELHDSASYSAELDSHGRY